MDRLGPVDATFYHLESPTTPMHVGSVSVMEGPAPRDEELTGLLAAKLALVRRYRQRVRTVPLGLGRPVWVDDQDFRIGRHVRHVTVSAPGGDDLLRDLVARVVEQPLDMARPLWEVWLVDGLEDGRWAIIAKVHHCMVDGVAGTDLMQLVFDLTPDAQHDEPRDWTPQRGPSTAEVVAGAVQDTVLHPARELMSFPGIGGTV